MACRVQGWLWAVLVAALAGCSTVQPHFGPEKSVQDTYQATPTLPNAVKVADSMKSRYMEKVESQLVWERLSGLSLIGLTTVGADLVLRGVAKSELVGMGALAGGIYATSNWVGGKPQQYIYAAGANAVQCAVDSMQPLVLAYADRDTLANAMAQLRTQMSSLEGTADGYTASGSDAQRRLARARAAVERARAVLPVAGQALQLLDGAGGRLRRSLGNIELQVANAVIANSPNLQALLDSLGSALPAAGAKIVGLSLPPIPADPTRTAEIVDLATPTNELETLLNKIEAIVARVQAAPSDDRMRQCNVNLQQAGLAMNVIPAELAVEPGRAAAASVSGGVLPYRATWIGARPPADQVEMQIDSGLGTITMTVKTHAQTGTYTLLLLDAARGRETLPVTIKAPSPSGGAALARDAKPNENSAACTKVPKVQKVQEALLKQGTKTVKVNGVDKPLTADGCMGPVTTQAMRDFMKSQIQNPQDNQIPSGDKLLDDVAAMLGV